MGLGAFLTVIALLLLLCHGLAYRGICRGDLFTTSSIGIVVLLIGLFIFFPVSTHPQKRRSSMPTAAWRSRLSSNASSIPRSGVSAA